METIEQKENKVGVMWSERSESIGKIAPALVKAQALVLNAKKDTANSFFKCKYADLASVKEAMQEPFALNELAVLQEPQTENSQVCLVTTLIHSSGEFMRSKFVVPCKQDAQGYGSAVTYARRYTIQAIAGIAPEEDDGNAASGVGNNKALAAVPALKTADQVQSQRKPSSHTDLLGFGKHKDKEWKDVPYEYVQWLVDKQDMKISPRALQEIDRRKNSQEMPDIWNGDNIEFNESEVA